MTAESSIDIRSMVAADLDRLVEIAAGLEYAPQWRRMDFEAVLDPSSPKRIALVAEDSGTGAVVGFAVAVVVAPEAELESIAVLAQFQRQGLAHRLFAATVEELRRLQVREVMLEVRASNRPALSFYGALGFLEEGRRPGYYSDPVEDAILMRLRLG